MILAKLKDNVIVNIAEFKEYRRGWVDITDKELGIGCTYNPDDDSYEYPEEPESNFSTPNPKYAGIEFEGVMCSVMAKDMWGLAALRPYILEGNEFNFQFENGNTLKLNQDNLEDFEIVWFNYRDSFFEVTNDTIG